MALFSVPTVKNNPFPIYYCLLFLVPCFLFIILCMKGFIEFIKKQGVVGLATGFLLGGAVSKLVSALVTDIVNPFLGIILGMAGGLSDATFKIGPVTILYGHFISVFIDFLVIALVVYVLIRFLDLDKKSSSKSRVK